MLKQVIILSACGVLSYLDRMALFVLFQMGLNEFVCLGTAEIAFGSEQSFQLIFMMHLTWSTFFDPVLTLWNFQMSKFLTHGFRKQKTFQPVPSSGFFNMW
jgi:hypothetical protein